MQRLTLLQTPPDATCKTKNGRSVEIFPVEKLPLLPSNRPECLLPWPHVLQKDQDQDQGAAEGEASDEDTLSVCSETIAEDFSQPAPQTDASTSMGFRRNVNKVETDSVRALYKRSLELDCTLKELDCELRSLQIKKIKLEIKQLEKQISPHQQ
ncbi:hypothetical protein G5714_019303 [Onychostoma macrolepis]|uniref:Uncharacterized protein n=1 Tax=Onychostoma macrolepis TaxID=369639 RepID=A0A7J6BW14_9TELE|nr:hypothetical protein G5714_019303 [Onychostoma macrolepis]